MKRALMIGIDKYKNFPRLSGCVNDVNAMAPLLAKNADGSRNFECRALLGGRDPVSRKDIIRGINDLLAPGAEVALFYFAGHGIGLTNDVSLASVDGDWIEPGVPLSLLLGKAQDSKIEQVIVILDCCHSGGGGGNAMLGPSVALLRSGLAVMGAARADQIAMETPDGRGQFSFLLCGALEGGAADVTGKVSLAGVYAYLAECFGAWDQRPTFKANLEESFELRHTAPLVPLEHLRRLPDIFESASFELPLDPTYERESATQIAENVAIYDVLTKYRDAKLIEFVGTPYLYYAAMESKPCRLTPHGQHYWQLATKGLL
ncbi:MAG TPA: caspase family protein [Gemmatimonadaceae bacterium]|jgi:hypothetical protein|nr:caspase family protein [Gemmatimonadaceae bacterium]